MVKRKKWLFVSLGVVVLLMIAGAMVVNTSTSREGVLNRISAAIDNNDTELLISVMPDEIQGYPTVEDSAKYFLQTAADNKELTMQLLDKENSDVANSVKEMRLSGEFPFSIEKSGKKLLFFDKYVLLPKETYVTFKDLSNDVTLKLNGKEVKREDLQKPLLAGSYEIEAIKSSAWTSITDKKSVTAGEKPSRELSFDLTGYVLDLSKELKGAEILFKGKGTGIRVGDPKSAEFGPIEESDEKEIQLAAQFPWGETLSSHYDKSYYTLGSGSHFYFIPDIEFANELFLGFAEEYAQASVKQSVEPFKSATDKFKAKQANAYQPSMFGNYSYNLIKTYFNKETPKIVIDKEGNPVMQLDGVIRLNRLKTDYLREKEYVYSLSLKALYDEEKQIWSIDEANLGSFASIPNQNEEGKYVITTAKK
ncbi:hypothetical protein QP794_31910 [Paenibacillus sp. UMB7766-LJ446]|uniref:Copper amine oxidase-like N-terminal domain-containing protein n=1 Tax=Paenibacillus urinalis TaxID=521520 RepID=A0AAX3N8V7_9BACL|nr:MULTISPECIES: hypothetical protein [Paenibacillaceae]MDK8194698.1 hypothetical protein [Paenibacillus sp. UMB7766-LJ446]WDH85489.1 hypothetical protein PUW23_26345 [Paenibacillus urinalis]GAK43409.1 hypothetical protein TCA2_5906 [Paenibacillus sp. TCA20]SDX85832.1 hypothetical protein SAMN05518848_12030 [Paenibacillus sp. PDC88]